jgi:hypothetical protein
MNDLDLVRELRATIPAPAEDRLAAGRDRMLAEISRPGRYGRPARLRRRLTRPGWRLALASGAVTAAAAVACAVVLGGTAAPSGPHAGAADDRPAATGSHLATVSLAARILTAAARTVATAPAARPGDRQWVYSKFVQTETGQPAQSNESWIRFDGLEQAYFQGGRLVIQPEASGSGGPLDNYHALAALPASPAAILANARAVVGTTPPQWEKWAAGSVVAGLAPTTTGQAEFDYLAFLLWQSYAAAPPAAQAHVYQAMAAIPGVTVTRGMRTAAGRGGVGVTANGQSWLILDPRTFQVIGVNEKTIPAKVKGVPVTAPGTVSMAFATVAIVGAPGQR